MTSKELACKIRRDALEMAHISRGSHIASALSVADILAVLYTDVLNYDIKNDKWEDRDRCILSKGHAGSAMYAALAEVGFFDTDELKTHYANGSKLSGHVSHKGVPGVEFSTGSLGHGMPVGAGMALAGKKLGKKYKVYVIMGDGECNEGTTWETALFANQHQLDNLVIIIDYNKMQALGFSKEILKIEPFADKWKSFGWNVHEIDGHNHEEIRKALLDIETNKPTVILANTIKGKGVSFMENNLLWHYRDPQGDKYENAVKELEK